MGGWLSVAMYKLIEFLRRIYVVLLFVIIEAIALYCYAQSTYYTQAKILARANSVVGGVQGAAFGVRHYFTLRGENQMLSEQIAQLESELEYYRQASASVKEEQIAEGEIDSVLMHSLVQYRYLTARVIANTINRRNNFITLNRGRIHGVTANMGVITPDGNMVGYVAACSDRYSVVVSLLNEDFSTGGKVVGDENNYVGTVAWQGGSPYVVHMTDLSKYADVEVGDEVIGSGTSHYFPSNLNVRIGYVEEMELNPNQTYYDVVVRLSADLSRLNNVILVENFDFGEVTALEKSVATGAYREQGIVSF